jgi:hypothetical protein
MTTSQVLLLLHSWHFKNSIYDKAVFVWNYSDQTSVLSDQILTVEKLMEMIVQACSK